VHLLHRLYGVDAPGGQHIKLIPNLKSVDASVTKP